MAIWLGLIIAPLLALADQTVAFALVGPGCATQTTLVLHGSHAIFLALAVAAMLAAWVKWQETAAVFSQLRHAATAATIASARNSACEACSSTVLWLAHPGPTSANATVWSASASSGATRSASQIHIARCALRNR